MGSNIYLSSSLRTHTMAEGPRPARLTIDAYATPLLQSPAAWNSNTYQAAIILIVLIGLKVGRYKFTLYISQHY